MRCIDLTVLGSSSVLDTIAKIPSGIGDGQLQWTGAWDMCNDMTSLFNNYSWSGVNASVREERWFNAQACRIPFEPARTEALVSAVSFSHRIEALRKQSTICVVHVCDRCADNKSHLLNYLVDIILSALASSAATVVFTHAYC